MAKKPLIIVESPTKANTIRGFLGSDYTIIASKGHVRTLPKIGIAIDIDKGYEPEYIIDETKKQVISEMKEALKNADRLYLATDEDREGESISWHLMEILKPTVPYKRMVFHEITKSAIMKAVAEGRDLNMNLVNAQEARRVLDRLYGYTISPVLWSKLSNKTLSAGRVQSPGLKLIVDRERDRMDFVKSQYWDVQVLFKEGFKGRLNSIAGKTIATGNNFNSDTGAFSGSSKIKLLSYEDTQLITTQLKTSVFKVSNVKEEKSELKPSSPFKTSTLQIESNRKLHLSAKDTMSVAQSLYEKGFITYMRTDSVALSDEGTQAARNAVISLYGKEYLTESPKHYVNNSDVAQEAHEAIRPAGETFVIPDETGLTGRELSLYSLIFKKTLACQMKNAHKVSTHVSIEADNAVFNASGSRIEFAGFMKAYIDSSEEDSEESEGILPKLAVGQIITQSEFKPVMHETRPKARYTEASLVKELEELKIGRPSTYASIIDRILEKKYVIKDKGALVPTFTGFGVIQLLEHFSEYIKYDFTSDMEKDLDLIASDKTDKLAYLRNFYEGKNGLKEQVEKIKDTIVPKDVKQIKLKQISEKNTITIGKFGPYVQDENGKYYSVPDTWYPCSVTDEMIDALKSKDTGASATPVVGTTPEGLPILYCTGRFGDYWQIGDMSKTKDVKRFKVPSALLGKDVPIETILALFNLPRTVGTLEDGSIITADIGRFGPYLKCNDDFRNLKDFNTILEITESEARQIFASPKETSKKAATKKTSVRKSSAETKKTEAAAPVKDFGEVDGERLYLTSGRYGFYLKYGSKNIRIEPKYQHDEELCKSMTLEEAKKALKK